MSEERIVVDGVEFAVGDELVYDGETTSEIIDFEVEDTDQGRAYWLIVRRVDDDRRARYLAGSIAASVENEGGYEIGEGTLSSDSPQYSRD